MNALSERKGERSNISVCRGLFPQLSSRSLYEWNISLRHYNSYFLLGSLLKPKCEHKVLASIWTKHTKLNEINTKYKVKMIGKWSWLNMHYRPAQNFFRRRLANCSFKLAAFRFRLAGGGRRVVTVDSRATCCCSWASHVLQLCWFFCSRVAYEPAPYKNTTRRAKSAVSQAS